MDGANEVVGEKRKEDLLLEVGVERDGRVVMVVP